MRAVGRKNTPLYFGGSRTFASSKGLACLTNKEVSETAGCAEGTLYKHFETKDALRRIST
ncbi:TetR family transcriptional regulator [Ktedonospora formicarum]|uniref:TetR family transcriptional regulator n=1 Tax=Ktedonospora formicarum TaxID=2778364 RepID=UPI003B75BB13